jgi:hypothetical protein
MLVLIGLHLGDLDDLRLQLWSEHYSIRVINPYVYESLVLCCSLGVLEFRNSFGMFASLLQIQSLNLRGVLSALNGLSRPR